MQVYSPAIDYAFVAFSNFFSMTLNVFSPISLRRSLSGVGFVRGYAPVAIVDLEY